MDNRYRSVRIADHPRRHAQGIGAGAGSMTRTVLGLIVALAAMIIILAFTKPYLVAELRDQLLGLLW